MRCPRCLVHLSQRVESCHGCHFSMKEVQEIYGREPVQMDRLHDAASCLRKKDRASITKVMDRFERRFPQLFFSVYVGTLPEDTNLRELGFWLLNQASICAHDVERSNDNAILLVIDLQSRSACLTLGYFAEAYFEESAAERCLKVARPYFLNGDYGVAISVCLKRIGRTLSRRSRSIRKLPPDSQESVLNPFGKPALPNLKERRESSRRELSLTGTPK